MQKIIFIGEDGQTSTGLVASDSGDEKALKQAEQKKNFKEHLYMFYLLVGTLAFTMAIFINIKHMQKSK